MPRWYFSCILEMVVFPCLASVSACDVVVEGAPLVLDLCHQAVQITLFSCHVKDLAYCEACCVSMPTELTEAD